MELEEYMASLTEQIHNKRAKRLVAQEINNHIEEQTEVYEAEGMSHEQAVKEAVRQMGNPIETGIELNKIHKPKMPWMMLGLVIVLMLGAIIMQAIVLVEGANLTLNWAWGLLLSKTVFYNLAGFTIILLLLYVDYNFIAKYAYHFYGLYLISIIAVLILNGLNRGIFLSSTAYYAWQMLFSVIFAGLIYKNRNRGWKGIGICLFLGMFELFWHGMLSEFAIGGHYYSFYPVLAEGILIIGLILVFAVWKGIFGIDRKKQILFLTVAAAGLGIMGAIVLASSGGMNGYLWHRIMNIFTRTENSYMNNLLGDAIARTDWIGGQSFFGNGTEAGYYLDFLLNCMFTYFGKAAGLCMIALYVVFLVMALRMSLKQSNRIGFLIGTACTVSILVRFAAYLAINMGRALWWTTLVPFFSFGASSAVMNGVYIGLILCVYRNSSILAEESIPQKRLPRIRITIE